jgi:secreted trypsin-like serine protease
MITWQGKFHCGATVIADRFLLTAAHCVDGVELGHLRVFMGHAAMKNIEKAIIHTGYNNKTSDNDIALLQLESSVEFGATIAPVCLPLDKHYLGGMQGSVVGWGFTSEGGSPSSRAKHANVRIYTSKQCRNTRYASHEISNNMVSTYLRV